MTAIFDYKYLDRKSLNKLNKAEFSEKGSKRLCFHEGKESDLHAMLIELKPNIIYKEHRHENDEMIFLEEGEIEITFRDEKIKLSIDDKRLLIVEKGRIHSVKAGNEGAKIIEVIAHN